MSEQRVERNNNNKKSLFETNVKLLSFFALIYQPLLVDVETTNCIDKKKRQKSHLFV
jgi:hypothetical protein